MEKAAIKELMYGGVSEMMKNRRYFYRSSMGQQYSHWTDEGKVALHQYMMDITKHMWDADDAELDRRAKELVLAELKK